eukprot:TRINITY_DN5224_c0_g1_i2.p1 TRINITY_DN5224_c0_g1~~TRINITY_DN5224_c0_g1_i2.p1  ORF type:complete len:520 (+),score=106.35 TRINITY_DN5224_c0_g1_i2:176-1735(+)
MEAPRSCKLEQAPVQAPIEAEALKVRACKSRRTGEEGDESETSRAAGGGWTKIPDAAKLRRSGDRVHVNIDGRYVSVIRGRGSELYCIDSICYHTGGPLAAGDIEEVAGELCVRCPWHHYDIRLADGAKPYQALKFDPATRKLVPDGWKYTLGTQRTHEVEWRRGTSDDGIYVRLSREGNCQSDEFAFNQGAAGNLNRGGSDKFRPDSGQQPPAALPAKQNAGSAPSADHGGSGGPRGGYQLSGQVLAQLRAASAPKAAAATNALQATPKAMHATEWRPFLLLEKRRLSSVMWMFRFALPPDFALASLRERRGGEMLAGIWHIRARRKLKDNGDSKPAFVEREYTPVSPLSQLGSFDLAIKIYPDGAFTRTLEWMAPGDNLEMCGLANSSSSQEGSAWTAASVERLVLLTAGSGVTPMIQLLRRWMEPSESCRDSANCPAHVDLVVVNRRAEEVAFRAELDALVTKGHCRFRWLSVLTQGPEEENAAGSNPPGAESTSHRGNNACADHIGRLDVDLLEC